MKRLAAVSLLVCGFTLPVFAQHAGAAHGGGFQGHATGAFRGSYSTTHTSGFPSSPLFATSRYGTARSAGTTRLRNAYGYGAGYPYGAAYPYSAGVWIGPGYQEFSEGIAEDAVAPSPLQENTQGYYPPPDNGQMYYAPAPDRAGPPPDQPFPLAAATSPRRAPEPESIPDEDAVTIVFKDGRPPQLIHNYALTRTMLYITDKHHRDIPLDQIDLVATQKVNHEQGIEFHLPEAR